MLHELRRKGNDTGDEIDLLSLCLCRHADIRDAILTLVGSVREQTGKLERHELRERQLGDALTRTLREMDVKIRGQDKNLENLAILTSRIDERLRKMEEMVIQVKTATVLRKRMSLTVSVYRETKEREYSCKK